MNSSKENIGESIKSNSPERKVPYPNIPEFKKTDCSESEEFRENLVLAAGSYYEVSSEQEANQLLYKLHPTARVICSACSEIKGNKDLSAVSEPRDLEDVDVGVIRAEFGVAETGMVWLTEKELQVNALGFLSQHLVILLDPHQIVKDMSDAYSRVHLDSCNYGTFMMGPSATADIGAYMVRGAQGARSLTVFFMKEKE